MRVLTDDTIREVQARAEARLSRRAVAVEAGAHVTMADSYTARTIAWCQAALDGDAEARRLLTAYLERMRDPRSPTFRWRRYGHLKVVP